jgi:hypothetical protein
MFIPESNILPNISVVQHAGPKVQMILVFLDSTSVFSKIYSKLILVDFLLFPSAAPDNLLLAPAFESALVHAAFVCPALEVWL